MVSRVARVHLAWFQIWIRRVLWTRIHKIPVGCRVSILTEVGVSRNVYLVVLYYSSHGWLYLGAGNSGGRSTWIPLKLLHHKKHFLWSSVFKFLHIYKTVLIGHHNLNCTNKIILCNCLCQLNVSARRILIGRYYEALEDFLILTPLFYWTRSLLSCQVQVWWVTCLPGEWIVWCRGRCSPQWRPRRK